MSGTITIVLADDSETARAAMRPIAEAEADMAVVGEADDVESARLRTRELQPSVLVLDLYMPGGPSHLAIPGILEDSPETAVVILTVEDGAAFAREAFRLGARGFVVKQFAAEGLVDAIRATADGRTFISEAVRP